MILKTILLISLFAEFYADSKLISDVSADVSNRTASEKLLLNTPSEKFNQVSALDTVSQQQDCYPWMFRNETSGACECSDIPNRAVLCDPTIPRTSVLDCYCMTSNHEQNETELGLCLYGCGHSGHLLYHRLSQNLSELTEYTCGQTNRESSLCGRCKAGFSPIVYSYDMSCINCTGMTYNWIKYIAVAYIPLTFFFLFLVIVRFSGTSPLVRGFISICQGMVSPVCMRFYLIYAKGTTYIDAAFKAFSTLYGVWNLDFFRMIIPPICLDISPIQALALDYAIAFYPLLLVVVSYILISLHSRDVRVVVWLWKPFNKLFYLIKQDWDLEGSVIKAFGTFFLLSYLKILNVTVDLLVYTNMYTLPLGEQSYQVKRVLYYESTIEYFGDQHLCYGIFAVFVAIFVVILPLVFLVVYPMCWFQKCLNYFGVQRQSVDMLVNCYQGYYKDGTNGTRDYRCFSIIFFLGQIFIMMLFTISKSNYCFLLGAILIIVVMFLLFTLQPYKEQFKFYNIIDALMLLILALVFVIVIATDEASLRDAYFSTPLYVLLGVVEIAPCLYLIGLVIWWFFVRRRIHCKLPCFGIQDHEESHDTYCFPDRIENSMLYRNQQAPLLEISHNNQHQDIGYGAA